ncbi:Ubiquitin-conjugating enzyme E2 7 [Zea mays]|uniref:Ubiquitin-conjugating enzyme E2 7 n=1 Tax=Zea mays TaxID=4577 RepID=A0A3L6ECT5_MAIZE|nr:Ubiquitin-conjugating enzyme E2 7 [Zea mays]
MMVMEEYHTKVVCTHKQNSEEVPFPGHLTSKSDVCSFRVVLLELMIGRRSMDKNRSTGYYAPALGFLMFAVGVNSSAKDFIETIKRPDAIVVGYIRQFVKLVTIDDPFITTDYMDHGKHLKTLAPVYVGQNSSSLMLKKGIVVDRLVGFQDLRSKDNFLTRALEHILILKTKDLAKNPVDGFSAGLVDDSNIFEWQVTIIGPPDTLYVTNQISYFDADSYEMLMNQIAAGIFCRHHVRLYGSVILLSWEATPRVVVVAKAFAQENPERNTWPGPRDKMCRTTAYAAGAAAVHLPVPHTTTEEPDPATAAPKATPPTTHSTLSGWPLSPWEPSSRVAPVEAERLPWSLTGTSSMEAHQIWPRTCPIQPWVRGIWPPTAHNDDPTAMNGSNPWGSQLCIEEGPAAAVLASARASWCMLGRRRGGVSDGGYFNAIMTFPQNYPNSPPSVRFTSEMWHPNVYPDGRVCISILHPPGEDPNGYELASERWTPVHTVESIVLSIISMLSSPNDESPANIEAAIPLISEVLYMNVLQKDWREKRDEFKKKVRQCVRKSQEML